MKVDGYIVTPKTISETIEVPGTLMANETTEIHPEVSGKVTEIHISEGKYISKGTLLVKLYDGDLQAQLRKLEVQLKIAQQTEDRQSQLLKIQGISQQDYDLSLLNVNNINADIEIIKTSIAKTEIRSPYNGRLGLKNISPGAYITPSTIITTITQTDPLKLDFTVPEKYTDRIKTGQAVSFKVQGKDKLYTAKVMATETSVAETTRSLIVRSVVANKNAELLPGTFANVILQFDPDPNALMVPSEAIIPQARGKKIIRYDGGMASFVDVNTGVRDSAFVQVTEGIKSGDTVVITGLLSIRPGTKIAVGNIVNQ
ncbi:MAG: efflux RND transporter periplasmic adaptor subunit [Terrimonas sp.]|nr:efflux RND transporter periplasmic adaptor subunit [Terrimonas sp.]